MKVQLLKMLPDDFLTYFEKVIQEYAQSNIASGRWRKKNALDRSRDEFNYLLPEGLYTNNHHFFNLVSAIEEEVIGNLWLAIETDSESAIIYDIEIKQAYRRQGFGTSGLKEAEVFAKSLGAKYLGLHVFDENAAAQKLYTSLGYKTVSSNMMKSLV